MNADERQQAIGNRLMKILVGLPRVDLDAGPQHRAGCNEHGQNSERPQRIVPDRALWMTRHKFPRSEEHTSELQSLMRISYAVFCLKQKNKTQKQHKVKE